MSAGALAYIFRIQHAVRERDNRLILAGTPDPVQRLFRMTNVLDALELAPGEEDAFDSVLVSRA
jgi:hypothetical protein